MQDSPIGTDAVPTSHSAPLCPSRMSLSGSVHILHRHSRTGLYFFIATHAGPVSFESPLPWGEHGRVICRAFQPPGPGKGVSSGFCLLYHSELLQRFEIGVITNVEAWEKVLRSDLKGGIMPFSQDCLFPTGAFR